VAFAHADSDTCQVHGQGFVVMTPRPIAIADGPRPPILALSETAAEAIAEPVGCQVGLFPDAPAQAESLPCGTYSRAEGTQE
jgi:hypothetical protein